MNCNLAVKSRFLCSKTTVSPLFALYFLFFIFLETHECSQQNIAKEKTRSSLTCLENNPRASVTKREVKDMQWRHYLPPPPFPPEANYYKSGPKTVKNAGKRKKCSKGFILEKEIT